MNFKEIMYAEGAYRIAAYNARIQKDEKVLVVGDYNMTDITARIARAAAACGAEVVTCFMSPREWDCQEPPKMIADAMLSADVIFTPVSVSIAWTKAMREALANGARSMLMTAFTDEIFLSPALLKTDFDGQAKICYKLAELYSKANILHLTTEIGTDLTFIKGERKANIVTSLLEKGKLGSAPNIEINVVPLEGTSNGRLVIDGSIPYLGMGVLNTPVTMDVQDGFITAIDTNSEFATRLSNNLKSFQNENCYNIAEFGVGLNPEARLTGIMLEDEGVFGTIHIGIGTSIALGGNIDAPIHYDLIIKNVTIELDGKVIQKGRELFI